MTDLEEDQEFAEWAACHMLSAATTGRWTSHFSTGRRHSGHKQQIASPLNVFKLTVRWILKDLTLLRSMNRFKFRDEDVICNDSVAFFLCHRCLVKRPPGNSKTMTSSTLAGTKWWRALITSNSRRKQSRTKWKNKTTYLWNQCLQGWPAPPSAKASSFNCETSFVAQVSDRVTTRLMLTWQFHFGKHSEVTWKARGEVEGRRSRDLICIISQRFIFSWCNLIH